MHIGSGDSFDGKERGNCHFPHLERVVREEWIEFVGLKNQFDSEILSKILR